MLTPSKESYDQPRQHIQQQRHYFANKHPSSQGYGFSCDMYGCESWTMNKAERQRIDASKASIQKTAQFKTVVLEKTLESPLDYKEIQPVHSKGDQSWVSF